MFEEVRSSDVDQDSYLRYLMCCLNLFMMIIGFILMFLIIYFDSLFNLIDNEYLPKHTKIILFASLVLIFNSIICRLDVIIEEWKNHLSFLKFFRHLQENNKSKHGLTQKNHKKLSLLSNLVNFVSPQFLAVSSSCINPARQLHRNVNSSQHHFIAIKFSVNI